MMATYADIVFEKCVQSLPRQRVVDIIVRLQLYQIGLLTASECEVQIRALTPPHLRLEFDAFMETCIYVSQHPSVSCFEVEMPQWA